MVLLKSYLFHDYTRDQDLDYFKKMNPYHPLMRVFIRFTSAIEENDLCGGKKVHSAYFSMRVPSWGLAAFHPIHELQLQK